jgi:hypothetical protein
MAITAVMRKLKFPERTMVRNHPEVKLELKEALLGLVRHGEAAFGGGEPNMENVTNALWLWFSRLPAAEADAFLAAEFPKLEAYMRAHPAPASSRRAASAEAEPQPRVATPESGRLGKRGPGRTKGAS